MAGVLMRVRVGKDVACEWLRDESAGARVGARAPAAVGSPGFRGVGFLARSIVLVPCLREPARIFDCTGCVCGVLRCSPVRGFRADGFKATAVDAGWCEDNWFMDVVGVSVSGWLRSKA